MTNNSDYQNRIVELAKDILLLSRNSLLVNLRFLDVALSQFELIPQSEDAFLTDGKNLLYNPKLVLKKYKEEKERPIRDYLHVVLHCVFQHMYGAINLNKDVWNLACDIAVEATIIALGLQVTIVKRQDEQNAVICELKKKVGNLTAEKIYRHLLDHENNEEIFRLSKLFFVDSHEIWYLTIEQINIYIAKVSGSGVANDGNTNHSSARERDGASTELSGSSQADTWKNISERMQIEIESFYKSRGNIPGNMMQNLNAVNREKYDYSDFLRKFAVRGEVMKVNDEEFDYIYYTYGLQIYKKLPLIEPLEYKEVKRIKEYVIAIDTSGSVVGEEVQAFLTKTYNILKSTESYFSRINLHIIQCDAEIQEHVKITTQDEFDAWIRNMRIRGLGGTDFRPVFSLVDKLINTHEFFNLKGLIYFTDGFGVFPEIKPSYETAFIFVNDNYENPLVPSWAIKLVLQKDEL